MLNAPQAELDALLMRISDLEQLVSSLMDYTKDLESSLKMANDRMELEQ